MCVCVRACVFLIDSSENAGQLSRSSERKKVRREKMQVREKVRKSLNTVFFQCFVAQEGRKVGSVKRRVRRHLGR